MAPVQDTSAETSTGGEYFSAFGRPPSQGRGGAGKQRRWRARCAALTPYGQESSPRWFVVSWPHLFVPTALRSPIFRAGAGFTAASRQTVREHSMARPSISADTAASTG